MLATSTASAQLQTPAIAPYVYNSYNANATYLRAGVPIQFSGRMLPSDATGTLTFTLDGVPVQTSTLAPQTFSDYVALGDTVTSSVYLANLAQRYQGIVAANLGLTLSYDATAGMTSCDVLEQYAIPHGQGLQTTSKPLYSVLVGTGDLAVFGVGPGEQYFKDCHQAMLSWLGTPAASKIVPGDPRAIIQSGIWTNALAFGQCCVNSLTNSTGSGDLRFTLATTGNAAYLWYQIQVANPGSFTVRIDGGPPSAPVSTSFPANGSAFNIPGAYALLRLPVSAGNHTFDIVAQSGTVGVLGMGSMPLTGPKTTILVGDVPNQQASTNAAAGIAAYTADIQADIALLAPDGLDLRFVPTQQYMHATPAEMIDATRPNRLGMTELAAAFTAAVTPSLPATDSIAVAAASYQSSSIAIGAHGFGIAYSGDNHYAPVSTPALTIVLYDPTSTVSLTADAAIYTTQSPITLTAYVPSANANGQVTFFDVTGTMPVQLGSAWLIGGTNTATLTVPALNAGKHTLMVQYAGDDHYNASSSPTIGVTVSGTYTVTSLAAAATRYDAGTPVVLAAAVLPAAATGTVTFLDGTNVLGQVTIVSGVATFSTGTLAPGIHELTAHYDGTGTIDTSTSPVLAIEIDPGPTVTALAPVPATVVVDNALTLTATISPATATGLVTFLDSTKSIGQATIVNGAASLTLSTLAIGTHILSASYGGDIADLPSASQGALMQVLPATALLTPFADAPLAATPQYVRYGAPIQVSGRILPSDATGTITFSVDDGGVGPGQTVPLQTQSNGDYYALGDSITAAVYLASPIQRYAFILGQQYNLSVNMEAAPGFQACQVMPVEILPNNIGNIPASTPLSSLVIGTGDIVYYGTGSHEKDFNLCHQAALSWLGVPRQNKIYPGDPGVSVTGGTWSTVAVAGNSSFTANTLSTASSGSLRFTLNTAKGTAYVWYGIQVASGGSFTVSVDGGPAAAAVATQYSSAETVLTSYGVLRLAVSAGSHTFDIVAQGGAVNILGMGTAPASGPVPTVLASDIPNQLAPTNQAAIAAYTSDIQANIILLQSDGLDIRFVPTQKYMFGTLAETIDGEHPNALGEAEMAQAFEAAIAGAPVSDSTVAATASVTLSSIPIGSHNIYLSYSGDSKYGPTRQLTGMTIFDATSATLISSDASVYQPGAPIQLSSETTSPGAVGQVTFVDMTSGGNVTLGSAWLDPAVLSLQSLAPGQHSIVAQFAGDLYLNGSVSAPLVITVLSPTTIALTSSSSPAPFGSPVTFNATLSPTTATGTVTLFDGASILGTAIVANGKASFTTSTLVPGPHTVHATYSGDTLYAAATSATLTQTVNANPTVTSLTLAQASVIVGSTITVNVHVSAPDATPTGTITIRTGTTTLASATLANAAPGNAYATITLNSASLGLGTFPLSAYYSGDTGNLPSDSSATAVSITIAPISTTASLTLSSAQIPILGATTITAAITSPNAIPTGAVSFLSNGKTLATSSLSTTGSASYRFTANAIGSYAITAVYTPSGTFASAPIAPATLVVTAPLRATLNPASITANPGTSTSATLTLTPLSGFSGTIQTLCQTTVAFVTCTLNAPAAIAATTTVPVQISISRSEFALAIPVRRGALAITLALMLPFLRLRRFSKRYSLVIVATLSLWLSGCANGGNFNSIPPGVQTVAITITASGVAQTTSISVNVQQ